MWKSIIDKNEVYRLHKNGIRKAVIAKKNNISVARVYQIINEMDRNNNKPTLAERLINLYPNFYKGTVTGAVLGMLRSNYFKGSCYENEYISFKDFFSVIGPLKYDEIMFVRNIGKKRTEFLWKAYLDYENGVIKDDYDDDKGENDKMEGK